MLLQCLLQVVTEFVPFCLEVALVVRVGFGADRHLIYNLKAVSFQSDNLFRVICQKTNLAHTKIMEDLRPHSVVSEVGWESQLFVGLDCIEAFLLKFVGLNFCREANSTTFLAEVEQNSLSLIHI